MKDIKQQFKEFRTNTPKHIQWILLGAAFLVVVILLTLLIGGKSDNSEKIESANQEIELKASPDSVKLTNVMVGDSHDANVKITVTTPVVIDKFELDESVGLKQTNNCSDLDKKCQIIITYKPTAATSESKTKLVLTWHAVSQENLKHDNEILITYSAKEDKKTEIKSEPVVEEKPVEEPVAEPEPVVEDEPFVEPAVVVAEGAETKSETTEEPEFISEPVAEKIAQDVKSIAPADTFDEPVDDFTLPPEKCSDFAIAGYNQSGVQIGWIKPEGGANYFHPFEDKDCSNPTGKYDFSTGIITSLEDGSKIGTDAEHIGYRRVRSRNISVPQLQSPKNYATANSDGSFGEDANFTSGGIEILGGSIVDNSDDNGWGSNFDLEALKGAVNLIADGESVTASRPLDRTFILRQFKPIPATIVSEVRADPSVYGCNKAGECDKENYSIPVRATVDRNVYSDNGRTIIIPTGTLLMGYLDGELPGPYQSVGRMNIKWYQFIRPDGVEFNFDENQDPYSADAQGRAGVPGHGSTDYVEQMVMPILTSIVPAAVNMIAPIADTVVNQINLDNNTIVQSGTMRSSEMAKQEVISTWNKVAQKLLVDALDNTTPPFSIAAGTRINVYSPVDLILSCGDENDPTNAGKKCAFAPYGPNKRRNWSKMQNQTLNPQDPSWIGQVRSFDMSDICEYDEKTGTFKLANGWQSNETTKNMDYRTLVAYCQTQNYKAKNNVKQDVYHQSQKDKFTSKYGDFKDRDEEQTKAYNTDILGLTYDDEGYIENPFAAKEYEMADDGEVLTCENGDPDADGCCPGEEYTDMGDGTFACCPPGDGDCIEPLVME